MGITLTTLTALTTVTSTNVVAITVLVPALVVALAPANGPEVPKSLSLSLTPMYH